MKLVYEAQPKPKAIAAFAGEAIAEVACESNHTDHPSTSMVRARGRTRGQPMGGEPPRREQRLDDVEVITNLQRQNEVMQQQIAELTQRLAVRDMDDHEESDQGSRSSFENRYHREPRGRDFRVRDDYRGGLGFKVEIPSFSRTTAAEQEAGDQQPSGSTQEPRPTTQGAQGMQGASSSTIKCYRCGEPGHRANECKKPALHRSKSLFVEENIVVDDDEVEEFGDPVYDDYLEDDVLYGDGRENLVVRKSLLAPKDDSKDDWLRTNIFHTTCTIEGKVKDAPEKLNRALAYYEGVWQCAAFNSLASAFSGSDFTLFGMSASAFHYHYFVHGTPFQRSRGELKRYLIRHQWTTSWRKNGKPMVRKWRSKKSSKDRKPAFGEFVEFGRRRLPILILHRISVLLLQRDIEFRFARLDTALTAIQTNLAALQVGGGGRLGHQEPGRNGGGATPKPKLEPPKSDEAEPLRWLYQVKEYFSYYETPPEERLRCVTMMLEGQAADWFRWRRNNGLIDGWDDFVEKFKQRFDPLHYVDYLGHIARSHVPPGFRFHPTEEELLQYYLRKKVTSQKIDLDVIPDVELNKLEPWDIQEKCRIGSGPQTDWYFFSHKDKKYPTGSRTNRATVAGFWKATGRDKRVAFQFRLTIAHALREASVPRAAALTCDCEAVLCACNSVKANNEVLRCSNPLTKGSAAMQEDSSPSSRDPSPWVVPVPGDGSSLAGELSGTQEECWVVCRVFKKKSYHKALDRVPHNSGDLAQSHLGNDGVLDQILTYMGRVSSKQQIYNGSNNSKKIDTTDSVVQFMHLPGLETEPDMDTTTSNKHLHHHHLPSTNNSTFYNQAFEEDIFSQTKPVGGGVKTAVGSTNWVTMDRLVASQLNGQDDNLYFPIVDHSTRNDHCHVSDHPNSNEVEFWSYPSSYGSPSDPLSHLSV
ncbi:unnamed protein product [Cuscuta campestris]|uniref:CCHC-type domain-containing protein n=1 Tax=Cuscuta campestris TaxID=132261 RepID=A0A484NA84_9ASTE|nr:unnamed protein product [Cuscuta campestris]